MGHSEFLWLYFSYIDIFHEYKFSKIEKTQKLKSRKLKTGQFSPKTQKFQAAKITHYTVFVWFI